MSNKTDTSPAKTNASTKASKRIKYGFKMEFPQKPFTIKRLTSVGAHPKYITAYMRVKKALANGEIEVVGEIQPKTARRGARELLYQRVNAKTSHVSVDTSATVDSGVPVGV